jgi:short-subunit dehydrogenase
VRFTGKTASTGFKMITAKECAASIVDGAENRKRLIVTPSWYGWVVWARKFFPEAVDSYFAKTFSGKSK